MEDHSLSNYTTRLFNEILKDMQTNEDSVDLKAPLNQKLYTNNTISLSGINFSNIKNHEENYEFCVSSNRIVQNYLESRKIFDIDLITNINSLDVNGLESIVLFLLEEEKSKTSIEKFVESLLNNGIDGFDYYKILTNNMNIVYSPYMPITITKIDDSNKRSSEGEHGFVDRSTNSHTINYCYH